MNSPYINRPVKVSMVMLKVLLALLPAIGVHIYFFGIGIAIQIALAIVTALLAESVMLKLRGKPIKPFLYDLSAVLTAVLLALCLPPTAPWWMIVLGTLFAIVLAKHAFGGLGHNIFNPAMVGFAVLIIAYPALMGQWIAPHGVLTASASVSDQLHLIFMGGLPQSAYDAIATATPLDVMKTGLRDPNWDVQAIWVNGNSPIFSVLAGKGSEWIAGAYLLGGLFLLQQKVISWHIPVALLAGLGLMAAAFSMIGGVAHYPAPLFHLFSGGAMLGAFFIATDPVSGPSTRKGQLIFAALIGMITYLVRTFGNYPDGIAFAVLLMNLAAPFIEIHTQPAVFGRK